jgi:hypothetical protein
MMKGDIMKGITKLISMSLFFSLFLEYSAIVLFAQKQTKDESGLKLKMKIEELESKLEQQKHELDSLQSELKNLKSQKPLIALPAPKDFRDLPKGATPFEFNGNTYYVVLIDRNKGKKIE